MEATVIWVQIPRNCRDQSAAKGLSLILTLALLATTSCATKTYTGDTDSKVADAAQQPFRDVGMVRVDPPELLRQAATAPYAISDDPTCAQIVSEIDQLDAMLGPDVDVESVSDGSVIDTQGLAANAILDVIGLPFRGIFRWASGANRRERELATAILSGVARRSFLKGIVFAEACGAS